MSLLVFSLIVMAVLTAGYFGYGRLISREFQLDDTRPTPAARINDGADFVPTPPFYLLGQHFSAIAAAGPIVGPVAACLTFGWLPCVLWILLGVIFIGAVHDFSALISSVRHEGNSIAELAKRNLGKRAYLALAAFIWLSLLYVIVAFTDITAGSFIGKDPELEALNAEFNLGGAVAAASVLYLMLALLMGIVGKVLRPPLWLMTIVFVPATLAVIWGGTRISDWLVMDASHWYVAILGYCFIASMLPLWLLQQPRGFLGGFVLYVALGVAVIGLLFGGYSVQQPGIQPISGGIGAFLSGGPDAPAMTHLLFPFLFVTIACGACSGFHGLVCGGTTSKQIARESHCRPIGFGAMLMEGFVAVIALTTVMMLSSEEIQRIGKPTLIYGEGLARFLTVILGKDALLFAKTFGTMAVATFIFDTLDVATRLGRYLLQEITGGKAAWAGVLAAAATAGIPYAILLAAKGDSWRVFWTLFGTSNQLLAALTLLCVTVWRRRNGKKYWFTLLPMIFVMGVTLTALALQIVSGARGLMAKDGAWNHPAALNAGVGIVLFALAMVFVAEAWRAARTEHPEAATVRE